MATTVEVSGKFVFDDTGKVEFMLTDHGGERLDFMAVQSMEHLHKLLVAISRIGFETMIERLRFETPPQESVNLTMADYKKTLEDAERRMAASIKSAEDDLATQTAKINLTQGVAPAEAGSASAP